MNAFKRKRRLSSLLNLAFALALWLALAPSQLGGTVTYLMISGGSMAPAIQDGDVAVVRRAADYDLGDTAAYEHPTLGIVLHRIIATDGEHFVMRGDNNSWQDSHTPNKDEMMGKLWFVAPGLGNAAAALRSPQNLTLFSFGTSLFLVASVVAQRKDSKRTGRKQEVRRTLKSMLESFKPGLGLPDFLSALILLTLLAAALCVMVLRRPLTVLEEVQIPYEHLSAFDYEASVPESLYGANSIQAGDPIFRRINEQFEVSVAYSLNSAELENVSGSYRLLAVLGESSGWTRSLQLIPTTGFSGTDFTASTTINISRFQRYVDMFEEETGIRPTNYSLAIQPEINLAGTHGGQIWREQFTPQLVFRVSDLQVSVENPGELVDGKLIHSLEGSLVESVERENQLQIFGQSVNIHTARLVSISMAAGLGVATVLTALRLARLNAEDEVSRIEGLYGEIIIPASHVKRVKGDALVEVECIEHLIRLAGQEGRSVLCEQNGKGAHYYVQAETSTYHYQAKG